MLNPLDVEQRFQTLQLHLAYPSPVILRLRILASFLASLGAEAYAFESYIRDCIPPLADLVGTLPRSGFPPELLEDITTQVSRIRTINPFLQHHPDLLRAESALKFRSASLHVYAGDVAGAVRLLGGVGRTDHPHWCTAAGDITGEIEPDTLEWLAEAADHEGDDRGTLLREMAHEWRNALTTSLHGVLVPVVEHPLDGADAERRTGSLRRVVVRITGNAEGEMDEIHSDVAVFGVEQGDIGTWGISARTARSLFAELHPRITEPPVVAHVTFEGRHSLHEGGSADLAVAALFYCSLLRHAGLRTTFRILPTVCITGQINDRGEVLPVDHTGLRHKVEAAFFSHVRTLVIPREQITETEELVRELRLRFPAGRLAVVGVRHLREVFYDLRVVLPQRAGYAVHLVRLAWKQRHRVSGIIAALALLALVWWIVPPYLDSNPVELSVGEETLVARNKYGARLGDIPVGAHTVRIWGLMAAAGQPLQTFTLGDANGDGTNEVFSLLAGGEQSGMMERVAAWSVKDGRFLWVRSTTPDMHFPGKAEAAGLVYGFSDFVVTSMDRHSRPGVLTAANHVSSFPGILTVLDAFSGTPRGAYVHVGHIMDLEVADINGDGELEILLCGVNNAYRSAFVAILDARTVSGSSPTQGDYVCVKPSPARHRYYVLIPRTIVGEQFHATVKNNSAPAVSFESLTREIKVRVDDGVRLTLPGEVPASATLNFIFNSRMELERIAPGDDYDILVDELHARGLLPRKPDSKYFTELKGKLLYWTGDGWVAGVQSTPPQ
jgi:hypothetical protein